MSRPYFQAGANHLEALFEQYKEDAEQLVALLNELEHRTTAKAIVLRGRIANHLAAKRASIEARHTPPLPRGNEPMQPVSPLDIATIAPGSRASNHVAAEDPGPVPKRETTRIRKPGRLTDVPDARPSFTSNKIDLKLSADAPLIQRYIKSLEFLVADMRGKNSGMRMVTATNGCRISVDTGGYGYQFVFDGDEYLLEGAAIVADVAGRSCEGQIASVAENRITISLREDLGSEIEFCVLRIDNTAMIEALRKRLEEISKGEVTNFNSDMASAVINNTGDERPASSLEPGKIGRLRPNQVDAASKALSNHIFYLWGPPGTGKTFTLSRVTDLLFDAGKKTLICSNTNQAVDQVLCKLCEQLKCEPQPTAMEAGQIVRIGKIGDDLARYHSYVTLEGITERKSADLKRRKEQLESEVERITAVAARAQRILDDFERLDAIVRSVEKNARDANDFKLRKSGCEAEIQALHQNIQDLRGQLTAFDHAWAIRRPFMRQPDAIHADIRNADSKFAQTAAELLGLDAQISEIQLAAPDLERTMNAGRAALAGVDRRAAEKEVSAADARKLPLNQEIAAINAQLVDIQKSIIEQARIVGATVTRLYLSPKMFTNFDVVIIDEASMVLLPGLFHAAGLAKEKVIVSGDFRQLPPIVPTDEEAILAELATDVFGRAAITKAIDSGAWPKRTVMLKGQSRMHDQICQMISGPMYSNQLRTIDYKPA
jgi:hypothetical protein